MDIEYKITFYSYWHAGGKDGANMEVDNTVLKDKNGMPYIGGKTMKGLIKDAARFVKNHKPTLVSDEFIKNVFGEEDNSYDKDENVKNNFGTAKLAKPIPSELAHLLFHKKSSTTIGDDKQAKHQSLRTTEVAVPLELVATIDNFTGDKPMLEYSLQALKKLGEKRFKGLGRCKVEIIKPENE